MFFKSRKHDQLQSYVHLIRISNKKKYSILPAIFAPKQLFCWQYSEPLIICLLQYQYLHSPRCLCSETIQNGFGKLIGSCVLLEVDKCCTYLVNLLIIGL